MNDKIINPRNKSAVTDRPYLILGTTCHKNLAVKSGHNHFFEMQFEKNPHIYIYILLTQYT